MGLQSRSVGMKQLQDLPEEDRQRFLEMKQDAEALALDYHDALERLNAALSSWQGDPTVRFCPHDFLRAVVFEVKGVEDPQEG